MWLPGSLRVSQVKNPETGADAVQVELLDEEGTVTDTSAPMDIPMAGAITYGPIGVHCTVDSHWGEGERNAQPAAPPARQAPGARVEHRPAAAAAAGRKQ